MEKLEQLYEGKAKKVYATEDPALLIVSYKDDATAFNGKKKGTISGKGIINNKMSNRLMTKLELAGVPTHFVEELNDRETLVKKVQIVPLEVIVRNISTGSFCKRYGFPEGVVFDAPTVEYSYKNDELNDPLICDDHILAMKLTTEEELETIRRYVELALQGDSTKQERKELLLAAKEDLLKKQEQIQESLDVINYKLDTYEQKCGPITAEMVAAWKAKQPSK